MKSEQEAAGPEVPPSDQITLGWLYNKVPAKLWLRFVISLLASLVSAFCAGVVVGQLSFVRELIGRGEARTAAPAPSPPRRGRHCRRRRLKFNGPLTTTASQACKNLRPRFSESPFPTTNCSG